LWQAVHFARYVRRASDMGSRGLPPLQATAPSKSAAVTPRRVTD